MAQRQQRHYGQTEDPATVVEERRTVPAAGPRLDWQRGFLASEGLLILLGLAAFMTIATPLWQEGQPTWQIVAVGLLAGLVMALVMAAITGYALMRLVAVPGLTQARCRAPSSP